MTGNAPTDTSTGSAAGDTRAQDDSKTILMGIATLTVILLTNPRKLVEMSGNAPTDTNPPKLVHNVLLLYNIYLLFLLLSFVLSIDSLVSILSTTPNQLGGTAWVRRKAFEMACVSLVVSGMLRIFLELPETIKWYVVLVPVLILGGISMYLLIGWIKANDSARISTSAIASSESSDEAV